MNTPRSRFYQLVFGCVVVLSIALASARAQSVLYIADGDSGSTKMLQGIDTTTGNILFSVNTTVNSGDLPDALAVTDSIWMISRYSSPTSANQYSLAGISTGQTVTLPTGLPSQFLDGTTDGINNYSLTWNGSSSVTVYKANGDWTNPTVLFSTSSLGLTSDLAGIAYDMASGNLWISGNTDIYQITLAGTVVSHFSHTGSRGGLAYQSSTDTLWYVPNNSSSPLLQYSKTGTLLQSLTVTGRSGNVWGAEFSAIPEPSTYALLALGAALVGIAYRRRRG